MIVTVQGKVNRLYSFLSGTFLSKGFIVVKRHHGHRTFTKSSASGYPGSVLTYSLHVDQLISVIPLSCKKKRLP